MIKLTNCQQFFIEIETAVLKLLSKTYMYNANSFFYSEAPILNFKKLWVKIS